MKIEIAFSEKEGQALLLELDVSAGITIKEVLMMSSLYETHPDILSMPLGIFSQKATLDTLIKEGDRIELYRPLVITPMEKRRLLARERGKK